MAVRALFLPVRQTTFRLVGKFYFLSRRKLSAFCQLTVRLASPANFCTIPFGALSRLPHLNKDKKKPVEIYAQVKRGRNNTMVKLSYYQVKSRVNLFLAVVH